MFELVKAWGEQESLDLSSLDFGPLQAFVDDLYAQNRLYNLTAVPPEECEARHILDSLLIQSLLARGESVLDVGTGAGFPAWPLAWLRSDLHVTALDSTDRRLRFIRRHPLPNLATTLARAEDPMTITPFSVVTGRAVAPLAIQAEVSTHFVALDGRFIPFRTESEASQFDNPKFRRLGLELENVLLVQGPQSSAVRAFPVYRKVSQGEPVFPRKWAEIKARPLM